MTIQKVSAVFLSTVLITGCATDDPNRRAKAGAAIGALAGAVIGSQAKSDSGTIVGAALGGLAGYSVGNYMDKQHKELELALADELASNKIELTKLDNDILRVNLNSEASFDIDQANLKPPFYPSLDKISEILARYDQTEINVLGHTDDTGEESYNQALSERRSEAVSSYLRDAGVSGIRLSATGRGELDPRLSNDTVEGRTLNRRVEIDLIPVVKENG